VVSDDADMMMAKKPSTMVQPMYSDVSVSHSCGFDKYYCESCLLDCVSH